MNVTRVVAAVLLVVAFLPAVPASAGSGVPRPVWQTRAFVDDAAATPAGADADDPAIWVHPRDPERSVVLGTLKEGGLAAFDLRGRLLALLPAPAAPSPDAAPGRFNNVDVLGDLAVVSDRGRDRIRFFRINPAGSAAGAAVLREVTDPAAPPVFSASEAEVDEQRTAYGLATGVDRRTGEELVVTSRRSENRLALLRVGDGPVTEPIAMLDLPIRFTLPDGAAWAPCTEPGDRPQLEGMVYDSGHGVLYAAQEVVGIWRIPLTGKGFGQPELIDRVRSFGVPQRYDAELDECVPDGPDPGFGGRLLTADAEGLTMEEQPGGRGRLLASSQGDSRFVLYDRTGGNRPLGEFTIPAGPNTDSVEHSDGAAVTTTPLGPLFPRGLLVVHDGERRPAATGPDGEELPTTGFVFLRR